MNLSGNAMVSQYIRQAAAARGINPDTAHAVAMSEGLAGYDPLTMKSDKGGDEGTSFGPFQLHYKNDIPGLSNAGMGDDFTKRTGLHASDPSSWKQQVDFALDGAAQNGWTAWNGAKNTGIGKWDGITDAAKPLGMTVNSVPPGFAPVNSTADLASAAGSIAAPYPKGWDMGPKLVDGSPDNRVGATSIGGRTFDPSGGTPFLDSNPLVVGDPSVSLGGGSGRPAGLLASGATSPDADKGLLSGIMDQLRDKNSDASKGLDETQKALKPDNTLQPVAMGAGMVPPVNRQAEIKGQAGQIMAAILAKYGRS